MIEDRGAISQRQQLAEHERKSLNPRKQEFYSERMRLFAPSLAQLIKALLSHYALALRVRVTTVLNAGRLTVERHAKRNGVVISPRSQNHVHVPGLETEGDCTPGTVEQVENMLGGLFRLFDSIFSEVLGIFMISDSQPPHPYLRSAIAANLVP